MPGIGEKACRPDSPDTWGQPALVRRLDRFLGRCRGQGRRTLHTGRPAAPSSGARSVQFEEAKPLAAQRPNDSQLERPLDSLPLVVRTGAGEEPPGGRLQVVQLGTSRGSPLVFGFPREQQPA